MSKRLESEAEFQDHRVRSKARGEKEPRDRFYFLADSAKQYYEECLGDVAGRRVLVVGCSEGGVTPLGRLGARVSGIDISLEALRRLNTAISREGLEHTASVAMMDGENLSYSDGTFDLITCTGVLHHLEIREAIGSWARALRAGGKIVMIEPMAYNPVVALYRLATPSMRTSDEHPLRARDIRFLRSRFDDIHVRGFVLTSLVSAVFANIPGLEPLGKTMLPVLEQIDSSLGRFLPLMNYFCWTVVIELSQPRPDAAGADQ